MIKLVYICIYAQLIIALATGLADEFYRKIRFTQNFHGNLIFPLVFLF